MNVLAFPGHATAACAALDRSLAGARSRPAGAGGADDPTRLRLRRRAVGRRGQPDVHGQRAGRRREQHAPSRLQRRGVGARRDPGLERAGRPRLLLPRRRRPGAPSRAAGAVLRQLPDAPAPAARQAPPPARRRHEGAHLRPPRLLRAERSAGPEDGRPRPALHARRPRPAARSGPAPAGRRRRARRQRPSPAEPGAAARRGGVERRDRGVARLPRRAGPQRPRLPRRARRHAGPGARRSPAGDAGRSRPCHATPSAGAST